MPEGALRDLFPRLFTISNQRDITMSDLWNKRNGGRIWELTWRKKLFVWETEISQNLLGRLNDVRLVEGDDEWVWRRGDGGFFR